jgi:hypothetical protein
MSKARNIVDELDSLLNDTIFKYKDHAIGGKLIYSKVNIDLLTMAQMNNDESAKHKFKKALISNLVDYMIASNLLEMTQKFDPESNTYEISTRCYLAPNEDIKILRTHI